MTNAINSSLAVSGAYTLSSHVLNSQDSKVISTQKVTALDPLNSNHLASQPSKRVNFTSEVATDSDRQKSQSADESSQSGVSDNDKAIQEQKTAQVIAQLEARDQEVKAHEMAHLSAAGGYSTGGMSFSYQTGPDGKRYAIGGEVGIDTSPISGDPEATLQKAMVIQRAALAPAEPSSQDYKVAQSASQMMIQARLDIADAKMEEQDKIDSEEESAEPIESNLKQGNQIQDNNADDSMELLNAQRQQFDLRVQLPLFNSKVSA